MNNKRYYKKIIAC